MHLIENESDNEGIDISGPGEAKSSGDSEGRFDGVKHEVQMSNSCINYFLPRKELGKLFTKGSAAFVSMAKLRKA